MRRPAVLVWHRIHLLANIAEDMDRMRFTEVVNLRVVFYDRAGSQLGKPKQFATALNQNVDGTWRLGVFDLREVDNVLVVYIGRFQ